MLYWFPIVILWQNGKTRWPTLYIYIPPSPIPQPSTFYNSTPPSAPPPPLWPSPYTCTCAVVAALVFTVQYTYILYLYTPRSRWPPHWTKIKRGKKGNSIWGWKNIGFYGDFRRRMQSKHNSHVYIPPWFYWIAGSQSCHKGHKMAVLFILVSPWLLWNDVSEVFWITSLRGGNATRAALATPPPAPYTIFYTYI